MFYADLTRQGYHLLRHHDRSFDVQHRVVSFACRIGGPDLGDGEGYDDLGLLQGVREGWGGENTHGDILNWGMWQLDKGQGTESGGNQRKIPAWAQVWAAVTTEPTAGPSDSGTTTTSAPTGLAQVQPARTQAWDTDTRFEVKGAALPPNFDAVPAGVGGLVVTGTEEYSQQDLFVPCMPNALVAPHQHGTPTLGTTVYDLRADDTLDRIQKAKLQTHLRVASVNLALNAGDDPIMHKYCGPPGSKALVIQMGAARGGVTSRGGFADSVSNLPQETIGFASPMLSGPLHVGTHAGDKHHHINNPEGDTLNALHLSCNSYFYRDQTYDAPLEFGGDYEPAGAAGQWWETVLRYDPRVDHDFIRGPRQGMWRWETKVPVYYPNQQRRKPPVEDGGVTDGFGQDTDPSADRAITSTASDTGLQADSGGVADTDPARDETFVTTPSADTNTPFNPDADQTFSTPASEDTQTTDPHAEGGLIHDGRTTTAGSEDGLVDNGGGIGDGGGNTSDTAAVNENAIIDRLTPPELPGVNEVFNLGSDRVELQSTDTDIDLQFTEPSVPSVIPIEPNARTTTSRAEALPTLRTLNEIGTPGVTFFPQGRNPVHPDLRNSTAWDTADAQIADGSVPAVARLEAIGSETTDGSWNYFETPGTGRYGQSAAGMLSILPPNLGAEQIWDGSEPATFPTTSFNFYQSQLTFGKPLANGLAGTGFALRQSGSNLVIDTLASDGSVSSTGTLWPSAAGDIQSALDSIGGTQGDVLYRGATQWDVLPAGTAGQALTTGGAGANPSWTTISGGGGLTTGTLAGRPATPGAAGDTYVCTDKFDDGSSGGADATEFFNVGILDALTWAKVALANFKQTISSPWTFTSGCVFANAALTTSGTGTIDANKLKTKTIGTLVTDNALIYNGTSLVFGTLGVAGGGTGAASWATTNGVLYANGTTLSQSGGPDARGGQVLTSSAAVPTFSWSLGGGTQTGTNTAGSDRNIDGMIGTGTGVGGATVFRSAPPGSTGSSANSLVSVASVTGRGSFVVNARGSAIAQNATDGFLYAPQCATGAPTGTPTTVSGAIALVVGSDNHLYFNPTGSAWVQVDPSAVGSNTLNQVLTAGNTTGGVNIEISTGDEIQGHDPGTSSGGGSFTIRGGNASVGNNPGGELILASGTSSGTTAYSSGGADVAISCEGGTVAQFFGNQFFTGVSAKPIFYLAPYESDLGSNSFCTIRTAWLNPTIDYTGATHSGAYEVLVVDPTVTNAPTGTNLLAAFRVSGTDKLTINPSGKVANYNGTATAGLGVPAIYASGRSTAQTAAVTSLATLTPAADGSFEITANALITTLGSGNFTIQVTYTDEGGTSRTTTLPVADTTGTVGTACAAAGPFQSLSLRIRAKASNAITIKTAGTFTSCTYNVEGSIIQIA